MRVLLILLLSLVASFPLPVLKAAPGESEVPSEPRAEEMFLGRWALTLPNGRAGWLEITRQDGWYDGMLLWGGGSVLPVGSVVKTDGGVTVTRIRKVERKDGSGEVVRVQHLTDTISARADRDVMQLVITSPRSDGSGFDRQAFSGRRIPPLPPRPDLSRLIFAAPITLFNGTDLTGWRLIGTEVEDGWRVEDGVLFNRPAPRVEGQPRRRFGNLRTVDEFMDFNLTLEVMVPPDSNSGVYLRGIYEVQVSDSYGEPLGWHNMGAIYSRITPATSAEKPAGEWQTLDMTLVDRHVTVILNGVTIIENAPLLGCTGGALTSDEFRPGPILLQGDHGPIAYRNIVLRPIADKGSGR